MNNTIEAFARQTLKDNLARCTESQRVMFKRMYAGPDDPRLRTPEVIAGIKEADIVSVIDNMPDETLDRAMQQVEATLAKAAQVKGENDGNL